MQWNDSRDAKRSETRMHEASCKAVDLGEEPTAQTFAAETTKKRGLSIKVARRQLRASLFIT